MSPCRRPTIKKYHRIVKITIASKYLLAYIRFMNRITKQKQSRKPTEIRRHEIIDAGMRILTSEGARHFTADRLGAEVGIASGTIFRHFNSMEEILDAIVDRIEELIFESFPPQSDNPLECLRLFFEARVQAITEHPEVSKLLTTSMLIPNGTTGSREKRLRQFKLRSKRFVIDCLIKAETNGLLAKGISYEESSILVLGAIYAIGHMGIKPKGDQNRNILATRIWRVLEKSLTQSI
jgi:AcrR family transcriptional regulator